jgi:TldD protein
MIDLPFPEVLKESLKDGGTFADIYFEETLSTLIVCEEDRIEKVLSGLDIGGGLRVLLEGRTIYSFTNQISAEGFLDLAGSVRRGIKEIGHKGGSGRAEVFPLVPRKPSASLVVPEKGPGEVSVGEKVSMVKRANEEARKRDPRVRQVRVLYRDFSQSLTIANSEGVLAEEQRKGLIFSVQVVCAGDGGLLQTGYEAVGGTLGFELFGLHPPEGVARTAADRSVRMLSAAKAPSGRMPVVLSNEAGGTMIHEAIGHGLEADLAQQGLSVYSGKIGEKVASALITVVDDPTLPRKRGSYGFDDEGTPSRRTLLVDKGILKGYLYDRLTAFKDGVMSTGNGRRQSYHNKPIPRMSNTMILPGGMKPEAIIRSVEKGLFVKKMGGGQVNTVNGDFVFEVSEGYLIEKGAVGQPVRGAILTGNGPQVLKEIDMVGDDLGFGIGTCGKEGQGVPVADAQPTLRIPEILVGGQKE